LNKILRGAARRGAAQARAGLGHEGPSPRGATAHWKRLAELKGLLRRIRGGLRAQLEAAADR